MDEQIVKLRRQNKLENLDIYKDSININGELIVFEEIELFEGKISLWLPASFVDMPTKIARLKYPSEQRPQIIKTNLLGDINFAFNLFDKKISPKQIQSAADEMRAALKKLNPANVFYREKTEEFGDTNLSWFEFKGYGLDAQIYYIIFLTSIGSNLLHGVFNCSMENMEAWKDAAFQVIHSIEDKTGGVDL